MTYTRITAAVLATALVGVASANVGGLAYFRREGMMRPLAIGPSTSEGSNQSFREAFLNYTWSNDNDFDFNSFGGHFAYGMAPNGFESGRGAFSFVAAFDQIEPDGGDSFNQITLQADYQINGTDDPIGFQYGLTAGWQDFEDSGSLTAFGVFLSKTFMPTEEGMGSPFDFSITGTQQSFSADGGGDVDDWVWNFGLGTNLQGNVRVDADWQTDSDLGDSSWFLRAAFPVNAMRTQTVRLAIGKDSVFRAEYGFKF